MCIKSLSDNRLGNMPALSMAAPSAPGDPKKRLVFAATGR
jgi:hypothetical protein